MSRYSPYQSRNQTVKPYIDQNVQYKSEFKLARDIIALRNEKAPSTHSIVGTTLSIDFNRAGYSKLSRTRMDLIRALTPVYHGVGRFPHALQRLSIGFRV
jgi:hypothetical protein